MTDSILQNRYLEKLIKALADTEEHSYDLPVKGVRANITVGLCHLPGFKTEEGHAFEQNGFTGADAFLARLREMLGNKDWKGTDALVIYFPVDPLPHMKGWLKYTFEAFQFFLTDDGPVVLYQPVYIQDDMVKQLSTAADINTLEEAIRKTVLEHLELALIALLREFHIAIARAVPIPEQLQPMAPEDEHAALKALITLLGKGMYEEEAELNIIADTLYLAYSSPASFFAFHPDLFEEDEQPAREEAEDPQALLKHVLLHFIPAEYSDWKFSAGDLEYAITELTGDTFLLDLPEKEVYSHDLFPYAQKQLAEAGWQLMNVDTGGDSYLWVVVQQEDVEKVLQLTRKFNLPFEKI